MDKIIRCITSDGAVMASAIDASDIVFTAKKTPSFVKKCHGSTRKTSLCNFNDGSSAETKGRNYQSACYG